MTFQPNRNLINKQLADQSHAHTSWDPEKRSEQEIQGFVEHVQNVYESMQKYAKTDAQKESLDAEMERYQAGYAQKYNADLAAKGRTFSSMITGGSKFPTRRHEKANQAEQNRYDEMKEWDDRAQASIIQGIKKMAVAEEGGELQVLKNKIEKAEKMQEIMKSANAIVRKKISDDEKVAEIIKATGFQETTARKLLTKDFAGRLGFPSFELTNNLANIHRMKERLIELEKKESTPTGELVFDGGTIIDNAEADRIQIFFDKIPSEEIRTKLKGSGWKWSPKNSAWQRMRTRASMDSAQRITGAIEKKAEVQEIKQELAHGETVIVSEKVIQTYTDPITGKDVKNTFDIVKAEDLPSYQSFRDQLHYFLNPKGFDFDKLVRDFVEDFNIKHHTARFVTTKYIVEQAINNARKKELKQGDTVTVPEVVLKDAIKGDSEILAALKIIKSGFDKWYSTGDTLDSKYSTDMLDNVVRQTTYLTKNRNPDVERLLSDLEKLGYKNLKEWYEPQRSKPPNHIKKQLAQGETVEVPKADIPGLMKKGTLPDPDWEFEKQVDEIIKAENEREVNPDDYYRDSETESDWGEDPDEIRPWMDFEVYKELELNKTIEIPETTLKAQISTPAQKELWEMTYQEFAAMFQDKYNDSGFSFAERIGKPLGIQSQVGEPLRIINGKKRGYPQSLIRDRWRYVILQDAINRGKKLSTEIMSDYLENQKNFPILLEGSAKPVIAEVKKEVSKGETVDIPEFKLIAGLRPTGKIEHFDKGKEYIGIKYKGKNFRGEWEERMEMTKHHGRPYSVAEWDSIIEYTPEKWAELKDLIQKEANANNRDAREDSLNVTVLQVPRWKSTPKLEKEIKYKDINKGETVVIPESTLQVDLKPMKNIVATYRKLAWDAKEKGKYKQAAQFYEIAIKDYELHPATGELYKADLASLKKLHAEMLGLSKVQKGETVEVPETVIAKAMEPTPTTEGARWRKFSDHKSETKAVKEALNRAGIEAEVGHGRGTGWGWLEINIGDPRPRGGVIEETRQYTQEEQDLHKKVLAIAKEVTGRHGEYDGNISLMAQDWRNKTKSTPSPSPPSSGPVKNWLIKSKDGKFTLTLMYSTEKDAFEYANKTYHGEFSLHESPKKEQYIPKLSDAELEKAREEGKRIRENLAKGETIKVPESKLVEIKGQAGIPDKPPYGKEYPRHRMVRILVETDKNGKEIYYQTIDPMWKKRISLETVNSLKSEGRAFLTGKGINAPISKEEFYKPKYWQDPKAGRHPASGSGRLQTNIVPFLEPREVGGKMAWYVRNPHTNEEFYFNYDKLEDAKKKYTGFYDEYLKTTEVKKDLSKGETIEIPKSQIKQIQKPLPPKYKIGEMVYSWQNPSIPAEIRRVNLSNELGYSHTYILRLQNIEAGGGSCNSKFINEESLSYSPLTLTKPQVHDITFLPTILPQIKKEVARGEIVVVPQSLLMKKLEAPARPLLLYPSHPVQRLEKGNTIEISGDKLGEMLQHSGKIKTMTKTKAQTREKAKAKGHQPCTPPVHVHAYRRGCPTKRRN